MHTAHNGSNPGTLFEPIDTMIEIRNAKQQMIESIVELTKMFGRSFQKIQPNLLFYAQTHSFDAFSHPVLG
jgi:hypothetical protein